MPEMAIFRQIQRDSYPLSGCLNMRFAAPALTEVSTYTAIELAQPTADLVAMLISRTRVAGPRLTGVEVEGVASGDGDHRPGTERHSSLSTNRFYFAIQIEGDIDLLKYWPDEATVDLTPVDVFAEDPWVREEK